MTTFFFVLLGILIISTLLYGALLLRLSLDDADFWLKVLSTVLATLIFGVGLPALVVSHFAGKEQQAKIDAQQGKLLDLEASNIEAQRLLEAERTNRIQLEKSLSPRRFAMVVKNGWSNFDELKPFKGTAVIIETIDEGEPIRTASFLQDFLVNSGWDLRAVRRLEQYSPAFTGISVERRISPHEKEERDPDDLAAHKAASTLVEWLNKNNISAHENADARTPAKIVLIRVGLKPDPFFFDDPRSR